MELELVEYIRILLKWKWTIIILFVSAVVVSFIVSERMTPIYQASTSVLVKEQKGGVEMPFLETLANMGKNPVQNYVEILKSRTIMEHVVAKLGLDTPVPSSQLDALRSSVKVQPVQGTDTIRITVESDSPQEAMLVANTTVDIFIEQSQLINQEAARSAREFITQQLKVVEGKLERAENALLQYKKSQKIVAPSEETRAQIDKIADLEKLRAETDVEIEEAGATLAQVQKQLKDQNPTLITATTVTDNPFIQQYRTRLAELETSLAGAREKYTEKHPAVMSLVAEIGDVKAKLSKEVEKVVSAETTTLNPVHQSLLQRMVSARAEIMGLEAKSDALNGLIARNEATFATLPQKELDITRLSRDQRVSEEIYVMLLTKNEEMHITEAMKTADIQRIDRAILPTSPIRPRKMLNVAIAGFLGLFVGCGIAFFLEYMDTSFKSPDDVEKYLELPIMGMIPTIGKVPERKRKRKIRVIPRPGLSG